MMKYVKFQFVYITVFCISLSVKAQEKCFYFKYEYSYGDNEGKQFAQDYNKGPFTKEECAAAIAAIKTGRRQLENAIPYKSWTEKKIISPCTCGSITPHPKPVKPAKTSSQKQNSDTQNSKPRPFLNSNETAVVKSMSDALYQSQQSVIDEKNGMNDQNAKKFQGERPSSPEAYSLSSLNGSSSSYVRNTNKDNIQNEVFEFDLDNDGVLDTRRITKAGEAPIYEKIENGRPSSVENINLDEFGSIASTLSELAESLGNDTYSSLGKGGDAISNLNDLKKLKNFYDNPTNNKSALDATTTIGSRLASALSKMSGMMFDKFTAPIPDLQNDVMSSSLESASSLLRNGTYDDIAVWRSVGNYFGNGIGMGNIGDRAKDFTNEGDKSWGQLKTEYGFYEGTKKAVLYYLLNDLRENSMQ